MTLLHTMTDVISIYDNIYHALQTMLDNIVK